MDTDLPEDWVRLGGSWVVRVLRPAGLWLRDKGWAKHVYRVWDRREVNGEYWEMFGWRIGRMVIPFSGPRRNRLKEMTTPQTLQLLQRWR
jgi:hypothetical protein